MPDSETDVSELDSDDVRELAHEFVDAVEPGTTIGDKVVLSRRQVGAIAAGTLSIGSVVGFGSGEAQAQSAAGQVGTRSEPEDAYLASINDGGVITDGDGTDRRVWVIASGASDPAGAAAEDLIFEEES